MLEGKLKDAATRCVLRSVDASKCTPPDLLAGFGEGNREGKMETSREEKGTH